MARIYLRALAVLLAIAGASGLAAVALGGSWGWWTALALLCAWALSHVHMLARLARWLEKPLPEALPEGLGSWEQVLAGLHRHERESARRIQGLAESLARFRHAAEALPDGVVILDAENRIEWCNDTAAAHLGLDPRADVGRPIANLLRQPEFVAYLERAQPGTPLRLALGADAIFTLLLIPYGDDNKLLLSRDVTQNERVETMRRDFVANVSHELRTPLTVLAGFLETVRELKLDPQRTRDYLAMMQEQAGRMQRIIEDLLTLSHLESAPAPAAERVRVGPLLERVRADAALLSGGRHRIILEAEPTLDLLGAEPELASAFGNLATNAVRYTPEGGEIRLQWHETPEGPVFAVQDTGVGIPPEHLSRLTERFYRVDRGRSRETGGTGLELAIVKHALARHQGTLEIESRPGRGSRFAARFATHRAVPARNKTQPSH